MRKLLLDSGAFTAWNKGEQIDLAAYIDFALEHEACVEGVVALDVIPGRPGSRPTPRDVEEGARQSFENALTMRDAGLEPVPVFHYGEDFKWLDEIIAAEFEYIGFGSIKTMSPSTRLPWLRKAFKHLCQGEPYPRVKVHGFGEALLDSVFGLPWHSIDSAGWTIGAGMSLLFVPHRAQDGSLDFTRIKRIACSMGSDRDATHIPSASRRQGAHLLTATPGLQRLACDFLDSVGLSIEWALKDYVIRKVANIEFWRAVERARIEAPKLPPQHKGFFASSSKGAGTDTWLFGPMRVYFAGPCVDWALLTHVSDQIPMLASYAHVSDWDTGLWDLAERSSEALDLMKIHERIERGSLQGDECNWDILQRIIRNGKA